MGAGSLKFLTPEDGSTKVMNSCYIRILGISMDVDYCIILLLYLVCDVPYVCIK